MGKDGYQEHDIRDHRNNGQWQNNRLKRLDPEKYRFKITGVKRETALAYLIDIEGVECWLPKASVEVGVEPGGNYFAVDMPLWLVKKNHLI